MIESSEDYENGCVSTKLRQCTVVCGPRNPKSATVAQT